MTIAFAGEVSREQAAALRATGAAVRCPSFEVAFDAYEYWQKPEVAGGCSERLPPRLCLNSPCVARPFRPPGTARRPKAFRAHVTLARKVTQAPVVKPMSRFSLAVHDFQLVRSARSAEGSVYTVVDSWPLLDNAGRGG